MVAQVAAGDGVHQHRKAIAVQRQPGNDLAEQLRLERQLATPVRVRADGFLVDPAHLQRKAPCGFLAEFAGLGEGVGVEVDVGVKALDPWGRGLGHMAIPSRFLMSWA
ncbi:hypothetical protein D3C81_1546170 [compost metagenome]